MTELEAEIKRLYDKHFKKELPPSENLKIALSLFPNPANESVYVEYSLPLETEVSISLIDVSGKTMAEFDKRHLQPAGQHRVSFSVAEFPPGIYFCRITTNYGQTIEKLMITH